jgi:hypothetical protein
MLLSGNLQETIFFRQAMGNCIETSQSPTNEMRALRVIPSPNEFHAMTATIKYDDDHVEGDDDAVAQASDVFQNAVEMLNRQPNWIFERMANSVTPEITQNS